MLKTKILLTSVILGCSIVSACAVETIDSLEFPKPPAYRVGISELPETQYVQATQDRNKIEKKYAKIDEVPDAGIADMTYADLSIKRLSKEIAQDLEFEEQDMVSDLSLLWQGAAMQSDTINFALYKLANPDADKPDEKSIKKVLSTIASMSTLVGASMGSPVLAGSSLIGGNILGIMSQDTKALNYKYTRVTDADMIILIRKVEDLQQRAVDLYYDYMSAKRQLEFTNELVAERQRKFELAQKNNAQRELIVITDAYYRTALDKQRTAKSEFFSKRAALEQFVGNETFVQFEAELAARDRGETTKTAKSEETTSNSTEQDSEYNNTIQNVEQYTNNLQQAQTVDFESNDATSNNQNESEETAPFSFVQEDEESVTTGSSSNIENEDKPKHKLFNKSKKEKKAEENTTKTVAPEKKYPKNSTKDLIFLHGQDKHSVQSPILKKTQTSTTTDNNQVQISQPANSLRPQTVDTTGLPPLDEIRIPDLTPNGYSIYSEYYGETNDSLPPL